MSVRSDDDRRVVFHADDFGMNAAVNAGIVAAFRDGLLTSTSLLANAPAAEAACGNWPALLADLASGNLRSAETRRRFEETSVPFDLGIHLNLTQGRPLTGERFPRELLDHRGNFPGIGRLFGQLNQLSQSRLPLVEAELHAQIDWMCDRGLRPTHVNGHQYVELIPSIAAMIPKILRHYAIPTMRVAVERNLIRNVLLTGDIKGWGLGLIKRYYAGRLRRRMRHVDVAFPDRFYGTSHAGRIDCPQVFRFLTQAHDARFIEIGVHPATISQADLAIGDDPWFDPLADMRPRELAWLCGSELPQGLDQSGWKLGRLQALR